MNNQFIKDFTKQINKESITTALPPGSPRRYEPECGVKRHEERIRRETKFAKDNKTLPFSVCKPHKPRGHKVVISCDNCGAVTSATSVTVGIICPSCKKFSSVSEVCEY